MGREQKGGIGQDSAMNGILYQYLSLLIGKRLSQIYRQRSGLGHQTTSLSLYYLVLAPDLIPWSFPDVAFLAIDGGVSL